MDITVQCWGVTGRLAGAHELALRLPSPEASVADALLALAARVPTLAAELPRCACGIGDALVTRTHRLRGGETLVLLPPVAGG